MCDWGTCVGICGCVGTCCFGGFFKYSCFVGNAVQLCEVVEAEIGGYGRGGGAAAAAAAGSASALSGWAAGATEGALGLPRCRPQAAFAGASMARTCRHAVSSLSSSTSLRPPCPYTSTIRSIMPRVTKNLVESLGFRV
jgi:hypothetical protein